MASRSDRKDFERKKIVAKRNFNDESGKKIEWNVGDQCRTIYPIDGRWYDAEIVSIDGDKCIVEFFGTGFCGDKREVKLYALEKPRKKPIQKRDKRGFFISDTEESDKSDSKDSDVISKPRDPRDVRRPPYFSTEKEEEDFRKLCEENYNRLSELKQWESDDSTTEDQSKEDQSNNDTAAAKNTFHNAARYPERPATGKDREAEKENYNKHSKKKAEGYLAWRVGDHCRAKYYGDNKWYEVKIVAIDRDICTVDFLGYDEELDVKIYYLDHSHGKKAIEKQKIEAKKSFTSDVDEGARGDDARNDYNVTHGHHHDHHHSRRGYHRNNDSHMTDQSKNYSVAGYNDSAYPRMPITIPSVDVPTPWLEATKDPLTNAMLNAWKMAGYYTGLYKAQQSASHQCCCCIQTNRQ